MNKKQRKRLKLARRFVEQVMLAWWLHGRSPGSRWWSDAANQFADLSEAFGVPEDWEGRPGKDDQEFTRPYKTPCSCGKRKGN